METSKELIKIPQHLLPFTRPSLTTEPLLTEAPYSYTRQVCSTPRQQIELCPPHWRRRPRNNLRHTLKNILLKDWRHQPHYSPQRHKHGARPTIMRMKDSDDYITARAANPRTGLISPSIGSPSPGILENLDPPEEILQQTSHGAPPSPTLDLEERQARRRANEGRRMKARDPAKWCIDGNGWSVDQTVASPRVTAARADAGLCVSKSRPALRGDAFVMNMPSAKEPQPFAYPGYSAKQIAAYEHYKHKTRRVSAEGYDRRLLRRGHSGSETAKTDPLHMIHSVPCAGRWPSDNAEPLDKPKVLQYGRYVVDNSVACFGGAELDAATFAPFASPRTPALSSGSSDEAVMKTIPRPDLHGNATVGYVRRKPLRTAQEEAHVKDPNAGSRSSPNTTDSFSRPSSATSSPAYANHDLKSLPRVRLVHPALAAVPSTTPPTARQCSFGCTRDVVTDVCLQTRLATVNSTNALPTSLFHNDSRLLKPDAASDYRASHVSQLSDFLIAVVLGALEMCRHTQLPTLLRSPAIDALGEENATPQQKADALKVIISTTGQALLLLIVTAVVWQVGSTLAYCVGIVLWPLMLPVRLVTWLMG